MRETEENKFYVAIYGCATNNDNKLRVMLEVVEMVLASVQRKKNKIYNIKMLNAMTIFIALLSVSALGCVIF